MASFFFNPEWDTGVPEIDRQHRELLRRMELLWVALKARDESAETERTLLHLGEYVELHFQAEEAIMAEAGYPGLAQHKAIHDDLRGRVEALVASYLGGLKMVPLDVMDFLTDWLSGHLSGEDRNLAVYVRGQQT